MGARPEPATEPLRRFAYVANPKPLFQGGIAATMFLALAFIWGWSSGLIRNVDAAYVGFLVACLILVPAFVISSQLRNHRSSAALCGQVEVDGEGVRWRRPDGTLGVGLAWAEIARAVFDAGNLTILLVRHDGTPVLLGTLTQQGVPSGAIVLERFGDLVELVKARVPTEAHAGAKDTAAARRTIRLGVYGCLTAAALYGANLAIGARLHWSRWLAHLPVVVGLFSLLVLVAGVRLWLGKGPMVSPLYGAQYGTALMRFYVVAAVANFVLLGLANAR